MLAKKYKLPIQRFVGKRGRLLKSGLFLVKVFQSEAEFPRFGVTVSSKVASKASDRNHLRRLMYDSVKRYYNEIPKADYWITLLAPAAKAGKQKLAETLKHVLIF